MITSQDIETTFVRAQNRINEQIGSAIIRFYMPDIAGAAAKALSMLDKKSVQNENNPVNNEVSYD